MFVPKMKFVSAVEFEIWTFVWRKLKWRHHDVIIRLIFLWNSTTNLQRAYLSGIPNFSLIRDKIAEIYSMEINRELWRKNEYWVTVNLTFDSRSPISIGSDPVSGISNRLAKTTSKSVNAFGWNFVHKKSRTHRQKHTQTNFSNAQNK